MFELYTEGFVLQRDLIKFIHVKTGRGSMNECCSSPAVILWAL